MNVTFTCPRCNQRLDLPSTLAGQTVACPSCKIGITVPVVDGAALLSTAYTPPPAEAPRTCGYAVASMILGIFSFFPWCICAVIPVLAAVMGHMALAEINDNPFVVRGKRMAIAGLVMGYIGIVFAVILNIAWFFFQQILDALPRR